ncbi:hypothetical protein ACFFRR_001384 [Megaselia abdita]
MEHLEHNMSTLPNFQVKDALTEIIKNAFPLEKNYELKIKSGSSKGDNYIGVVYRATVIQRKEKKDAKDNFSVIIKVPPQNPIRRKQFFARPCFLREALAYEEILPIYKEFQNKKKINLEDSFFEYPDCYKTLTEDYHEAVFLKDLQLDGFRMFNRLEELSLDYVILVIKILAKLHAVCFAIKDQNPDLIEKYKTIPDIFEERREDVGFRFYLEELKGRAMDSLNPKTDEKEIHQLTTFFRDGTTYDYLMNSVDGKSAEPYSVLGHRDCWNNNVLFKRKGGKPVEARLIDWQLMCFCSPVCDLSYYIFSCTTKSFRNEHYEEILEIYHQELSKLIKLLGSDPEKLFPRSALNDHLKRFGKLGLIMAMILMPIVLSQAENVPDLDELSEQLESGSEVKGHFSSDDTAERFNKRMRDVIIDMVELGYI